MPEGSSQRPDEGDPSLGEGRSAEPAPVDVRHMARYLTVHPEDADLVRELREAGRERRLQQEPLPLCDEGREILAELRKRRRPEPMVDLMDAPIPTAEEEAQVAPPEEETSADGISISIARSEPPSTPPPTPDEAPDALQA